MSAVYARIIFGDVVFFRIVLVLSGRGLLLISGILLELLCTAGAIVSRACFWVESSCNRGGSVGRVWSMTLLREVTKIHFPHQVMCVVSYFLF